MVKPCNAIVPVHQPASAAPKQLSMLFESRQLRGMSLSERSKAVAQLAYILILASGVKTEGLDDDGL